MPVSEWCPSASHRLTPSITQQLNALASRPSHQEFTHGWLWLQGFITNKSSQQHHHHYNEVPSPNLQFQRPHLKSPNSSNSASEKLALPPVHPSHEQSHTVFATRSEKKSNSGTSLPPQAEGGG
ncbi:hypothetical protein QC761_200492 [Podospora bellae-mahoneyi]|uniref:Uncharacterized protein n=1 Tax=Podospora bellae-mahoneyi TaxID=2093777 RepID=A0ABR0FQB8_9PEZI|nr:hypothetical protein QC761_200492 [Podospora bellae-mahoneyi]